MRTRDDYFSHITQIWFLMGLQGHHFTQISQISQIWFMIVLSAVMSHMCLKSYLPDENSQGTNDSWLTLRTMPQKLYLRGEFSRHKWLLTYIEDRKRQGCRFSGKKEERGPPATLLLLLTYIEDRKRQGCRFSGRLMSPSTIKRQGCLFFRKVPI